MLLEKGDIDIARNLETEQLKSVDGNKDIKLLKKGKGSLYYLSMNLKDPILAKPQVQEALKYLVDYKGLEDTVWAGRGQVQQAFLPKGFLGALEEQPFSLNVEKAKGLLAEAGYPDGFEIEMIVPSNWLRWLKLGINSLMAIDETGENHHIEISRIGASVDPVSQTVRIFAHFIDGTPNILAGMSGTVLFNLPDEHEI